MQADFHSVIALNLIVSDSCQSISSVSGNYSKFDLPNETQTLVNVGIDIKDIPKIDDQEYSITLNAFFVVRWTDERMIIDQEKMDQVKPFLHLIWFH